MGGFPGPKPGLVAIILAIELDQVDRDQGGTRKRCVPADRVEHH
jgi:hypothetical protein